MVNNLPKNLDLSGQVAVVTGAGGILCKEFAKAISASGAKVLLLDINYDSILSLEKEINENGGTAYAVKTNVLDKEDLQKAHDLMVEKLGECNILINGAGGNNPRGTTTKEYFTKGDIEDTSVQSFFDLDKDGVQFVFDLNFLGILLPTQIFAKDLIGKDNAVVINISSMNAFTPLTKIPAYSGAKAAVSNFTKWLAVHFSKENIRVNAIAPGFFVTNQNYSLLFDENDDMTERSKKIINATPMARFGKPEELLGTLLWLLNDAASGFVTGTVIPVDGGFSAYAI